MTISGELLCPHCGDELTVPSVGESMRCACGRFDARRLAIDTYTVRAPLGPVGRALEKACWLETPGPAVLA